MTFNYHTNAGQDIGRLAWPFLGLVAAALTATVVLELEVKADAVPVAEQSVVPAPVAQPVAVVASLGPEDSLQWAKTMLARPLFNRDRRPSADTPVANASSPKLPRLTGVVVIPAGGFAIFAGLNGDKPIVAREGDQVGDAVIEAIVAGQVTLRGPGGLAVLHPSFGEKNLQVGGLRPASPARTGSRPRQGGNDAAILKRSKGSATTITVGR